MTVARSVVCLDLIMVVQCYQENLAPKLTKNIQKNCKLQDNQKSKELEFLRDFFVCLFE